MVNIFRPFIVFIIVVVGGWDLPLNPSIVRRVTEMRVVASNSSLRYRILGEQKQNTALCQQPLQACSGLWIADQPTADVEQRCHALEPRFGSYRIAWHILWHHRPPRIARFGHANLAGVFGSCWIICPSWLFFFFVERSTNQSIINVGQYILMMLNYYHPQSQG